MSRVSRPRRQLSADGIRALCALCSYLVFHGNVREDVRELARILLAVHGVPVDSRVSQDQRGKACCRALAALREGRASD